MRQLARSPMARPLVATLLAAVVYGGYQLWLVRVGAAVLPESVLAGAGDRVGLQVTLAVDPEPFHMARLQDLGRVIAVDGRTALIADAAPQAARAFARNYWVTRIASWRQP
jgi:hypothetical protein